MNSQNMIQPLLNGMVPDGEIPAEAGSCTFYVVHEASGTKLQVRKISIPESASNTDALILTGTISDASEADEYYLKDVNRYRSELGDYSKLVKNPTICGFLRYQTVKKDNAPGYDLYLLSRRRETLAEYLKKRDYTQKDALQLAEDLAEACNAFRNAGFMHQHITLQTVVLDNGRFCIGDLGLASLETLTACTIPAKYISTFTPPELSSVTAKLNETADTYAIGMLLYFVFNGCHLPFEEADSTVRAANRRRIKGEALPSPMYADYEIDAIIRKACAFDPADRYQNPKELLDALSAYENNNTLSFEPLIPAIVHDDPITEISGNEKLLEETGVLPRISNGTELTQDFKDSFTPNTEGYRRKKASPWAWIAAFLILLLGAGAAYFYFYYSAISVTDISVSERGVDYITVDVGANNLDDLMISCVSNSEEAPYTETYRCSASQTFTNLSSSTSYTITVTSLDWHYLKGNTELSAATSGYTNIVSFDITDNEDGSATVTLQVSGPEPESWDLVCIDENDSSTVYTMSDHSCTVYDLSPNKNYLFRVDAGSGYYLSGDTQKNFCRSVTINGSNLTVVSSDNGQISIKWESDSTIETEWTAVCSGGNGYSNTVTTTECSAVFENITGNSDYTISVSNVSMEVPMLTTVRISAGKVLNLKSVGENGGLTVTWSYEGNYEPESWILRWTVESAGITGDIASDTCSAFVPDLVPGTVYTVEVLSAAGDLLDGNTSITYTVSNASEYDEHDFGVPSVKFYNKPDDNWTVSTLGDAVTSVAPDKEFIYTMSSMYTPRATTEDDLVQIVIRDEDGNAVSIVSFDTTYDKLWDDKTFAYAVTAPATSGNYTVELYLNQHSVCKTALFVNE